MASLSGLFPKFLRRWASLGWFAALMAASAATSCGALPAYVREALHNFSPELPANWAFTLTTQRDELVSTERYDPAKPLIERWTLLRHNGQPPTASDLARYAQLKAANPTPVSQTSFKKADIEPGSLQLVSETEERAEYTGGFREISTATDKLLGRLRLRLTINKRLPHIEQYTLELTEPHTPVLGVKMNRLVAHMTFTPPAAGRPSLPASFTSDFVGRILFFSTHEKLSVIYTDFTPAP